MKKQKSYSQFWPVLTTVNIAALIYPVNLLVHANSVDENLFAAFAFIGLVFLLLVVDAVSFLVAQEVGYYKVDTGESARRFDREQRLLVELVFGTVRSRKCQSMSDIATRCICSLAI